MEKVKERCVEICIYPYVRRCRYSSRKEREDGGVGSVYVVCVCESRSGVATRPQFVEIFDLIVIVSYKYRGESGAESSGCRSTSSSLFPELEFRV